MIVIGADKPPETFLREGEHRAQIARYLGRVGDELESSFKIVHAGTITTTASQTTTSDSQDAVSASDAVFMFPADSIAAAMVASCYATCSAGSIDMTHPSQGTTGVFHVAVVAL